MIQYYDATQDAKFFAATLCVAKGRSLKPGWGNLLDSVSLATRTMHPRVGSTSWYATATARAARRTKAAVNSLLPLSRVVNSLLPPSRVVNSLLPLSRRTKPPLSNLTATRCVARRLVLARYPLLLGVADFYASYVIANTTTGVLHIPLVAQRTGCQIPQMGLSLGFARFATPTHPVQMGPWLRRGAQIRFDSPVIHLCWPVVVAVAGCGCGCGCQVHVRARDVRRVQHARRAHGRQLCQHGLCKTPRARLSLGLN